MRAVHQAPVGWKTSWLASCPHCMCFNVNIHKQKFIPAPESSELFSSASALCLSWFWSTITFLFNVLMSYFNVWIHFCILWENAATRTIHCSCSVITAVASSSILYCKEHLLCLCTRFDDFFTSPPSTIPLTISTICWGTGNCPVSSLEKISWPFTDTSKLSGLPLTAVTCTPGTCLSRAASSW